MLNIADFVCKKGTITISVKKKRCTVSSTYFLVVSYTPLTFDSFTCCQDWDRGPSR